MDDKTISIDAVELDDLTIDEIDAVEEITGRPLDDIGQEGARRGPLLRALAVIVKHREDADEYPIGTPVEVAESKRKVGAFRIEAAKPDAAPAPVDGPGNDKDAPVVSSAPATPSADPETPVS